MKNYLYIYLIGIVLTMSACDGSKTTDPIPTNTGITGPTGSTGNTGSTGGTGGTGYATTTYTISTASALVDYDVAQKKVESTNTTNARMGGIKTTTGGTVQILLLSVKDAEITVTNLSDAISVVFNKTADPILEYIVTDNTAKTITKYDCHFNTGTATNYLTLQGPATGAFPTGGTYNAAYIINAVQSTTQLIQKMSVQ